MGVLGSRTAQAVILARQDGSVEQQDSASAPTFPNTTPVPTFNNRRKRLYVLPFSALL